MGDAELLLSCQHDVLWLLLCVEGKQHPYARGIILSQLQIAFLKAEHPLVYELYSTNLASFNEEMGEIALSVLARSVIGENACAKVEKLSTNFQLLHEYRHTVSEMT